jgi:hypothetical protein
MCSHINSPCAAIAGSRCTLYCVSHNH